MWLIPAILLGTVGFIFPIEAKANSAIKTRPPAQSIPNNAVSFDFFGLFKGAARYVQVANISDEQEVEIGKQINQQLLSQQYNLANNAQLQEYVDNIGQE
ncbi:MAG: hypothetical protein ACFCAD_17490, partial [Pleurocapsa sp.]